ncbi:MAG: mannonate dehydratase [Planctomycetaceae bacterium]|nr:mannonate dehydratase [Planctomycetaceae bacterium]
MRLATVLTPINAHNLQLAAQCGVEEVVARYPGPDIADWKALQSQISAWGMQWTVIEGNLPFENMKRGRDDGAELREFKSLLRQAGELGIPLVCYNWMAGTDWVRTRTNIPARGGAWVTGFSLAEVDHAISLDARRGAIDRETIDAPTLWTNLERMLSELIPVAEQAGVTLCMHPDDPPLPEFLGRARIMNSVEGFERLMKLVPSPQNAICFCQGSFATMGVDIPATIRRLGPHIKYIHFRDVSGTPEDFVETFHDIGPTDMAAAIRAYREMGVDAPIRPDHVPQMVGEEDGEPGYTMQGRLFAYGYIRGLLQATKTEQF